MITAFIVGFLLGCMHLYLLTVAADGIIKSVIKNKLTTDPPENDQVGTGRQSLLYALAFFRVTLTALIAGGAILYCGVDPVFIGVGLISSAVIVRIVMILKSPN